MKTNIFTKVQEEKKAVKEDISKANTQAQGESLLLPLLQGLLHKNTPQARSQTLNETSNKTVSNIKSGSNLDNTKPSNSKITQPNKSYSEKFSDKMYSTSHHVEDSGTESGEDLKFIAAGLRDSMQMHSMKSESDGDLISEVTTALNRLEQSLKEGNDLKLEPSKKTALLNLVGRLQTGLISPEKITASTPSPGQNPWDDHETSSPEADARRASRPGHQRFAKRRNRASRHTVGVSREELADARRYIEEMVMMETLSNCTTPESTAVTPPEFILPTEKLNPGNEIKGKSPETSTLYRPNQFVPSHLKDTANNIVTSPAVQLRDKKPKYSPSRQSAHMDPLNSMMDDDAKNKRPLSESYDYNPNHIPNVNTHPSSQYSAPPDQIVLEKNLYNQTHHSVQQPGSSTFNGLRPSAYTTDNAESKFNRFSNKKLMMKRANTIDIPKPMKYIHDMESDSEAEERGISSTKSIGLRGTVQVSVKSTPRQVVPPFRPKTENDHKFLAFIQKQTPNPGIGWNNPNKSHSTTVNNWSNKFGNIKNAFETGAIATSGKPPVPASAARNFWKKTETHNVDRAIKPPWAGRSSDVMMGALKVTDEHSEYVPKPLPVNKFSHAPMSAFRPVESVPVFPETQFQPIHPSMQSSYPVFGNQTLKSPTKSFFAGRAVSNSPTSCLPWASKPNAEHRVLNMAASKFESRSPTNGLQRHGSLRDQERVNSYNNSRLEQKRPSLPNAAQYNSDLTAPNYKNIQRDQQEQQIASNFPPLPYTCTDYTEPSCVSTYIPEDQRERADSLTNPNSEPLVLTSNRPIISPNVQTKPQQPLTIFDYPSSPESPNHTLNDVTDDELDNSLTEYKAESKVMKGPVSQQAVTVSSRTARVGEDEKYGRNSKAAKSLLSVMKNISNGKPAEKKAPQSDSKPIPQTCISPDGSSYHAPHVEPAFPTLESPTSNRKPTYINQQPNVNVQYQSQRSGSHQSQPPTPQSQVSSVSYQTQSSVPYSPSSAQSQPQFGQSRAIPYQTQSSIPYATHPMTPQSPQYSNGHYQQNPTYIPPMQQQPVKPEQLMASYQQTHHQQYQQRQHQSQQNVQYPQYQPQPRSQEKPVEQSKTQVHPQYPAPSGPPQKQIHPITQSQYYQKTSQESKGQQHAMQRSQETRADYKMPQKPDAGSKKQTGQQTKATEKTVETSKILKTTPQAVNQRSRSLQETSRQSTQKIQRQNATEADYKKKIQEETKTTVSAKATTTTVKSAATISATTQQQKSITSETQVYKSSQPADTPDIVKSSLPKEDFPILKKFGPARPHLYMPNAYQYPLAKSESTKQAHSTIIKGTTSRKFSEGSVVTKFVAPEIVEIPSTPLLAPKDEIPTNIVCKNIAQFTSMARRSFDSTSDPAPIPKFGFAFGRPNPLSKSDSWHQIVQQQNAMKPPSPKGFAPSEGNPLRRVKSGHSLAIPKMFEAGINKEELVEKQKTVAAYFSGQKSPNSLSRNSSQTNIPETIESNKTISSATVTVKKSSVSRVKTSEKTSIGNQNPSSGLSRSQTMPHIANIHLLDESNVDDAFEQLLNNS